MKLVTSLIAAGFALAPTPVSALPDIEDQSAGECTIIAAISAAGPPTMIAPDPTPTALRIIQQCGVRVPRNTGTGTMVSQETLWLDIHPTDACRVGLRWDGYDCNGDAWLP